MVYLGKVHEGVVVLQPGIQLPDGLEVTVEPLPAHQQPPNKASFPFNHLRNGVPVFPLTNSGTAPGLDLVNRLRDESP